MTSYDVKTRYPLTSSTSDFYDKIKSALAIRDSCKKNIDLIRVSIDGEGKIEFDRTEKFYLIDIGWKKVYIKLVYNKNNKLKEIVIDDKVSITLGTLVYLLRILNKENLLEEVLERVSKDIMD